MSTCEWAFTADNARLLREIVAVNVRRERQRAGISHRAVAASSGLDKGTVADVERARREARISTLVALSFGLCVPLQSLLAAVPSPESVDVREVTVPADNADWTLTSENVRLIREIVGRNLRRERERMGITLTTLARKSLLGEDTILRTERARQEPKLFTVVALSFGLSVPVALLLAGIPSP